MTLRGGCTSDEAISLQWDRFVAETRSSRKSYLNCHIAKKRSLREYHLWYNLAAWKSSMERSRSWPSAHAWNVCNPQGFAGSNPALSARKRARKSCPFHFNSMIYFQRFLWKNNLASPTLSSLFLLLSRWSFWALRSSLRLIKTKTRLQIKPATLVWKSVQQTESP